MEKVCIVCGEKFEPSWGNQKICSTKCKSESFNKYRREYFRKMKEENPDKYAAYLKKERGYEKSTMKRLKEKVFKHYGGDNPSCACCGENHMEFLVIDHINGDGAVQRKKEPMIRNSFYRWIVKKGYPDDLQILCYNCNRCKGNKDVKFCSVHHPELYPTIL
jgi:hypothetical protein